MPFHLGYLGKRGLAVFTTFLIWILTHPIISRGTPVNSLKKSWGRKGGDIRRLSSRSAITFPSLYDLMMVFLEQRQRQPQSALWVAFPQSGCNTTHGNMDMPRTDLSLPWCTQATATSVALGFPQYLSVYNRCSGRKDQCFTYIVSTRKEK